MSLKESGEMYLETIYILSEKQKSVRSIDIADFMNFSKPSVSRGVGLLREEKYIEVDKNGYISLTAKGYEMAKNIFERHTILTEMLEDLGVQSEIASEDACRIEHVISQETFDAIKNYLQNRK